MSALYIHIPFCNAKCIYCDFYSIATKSLVEEFINALKIELFQRKVPNNDIINTIYFGGGTPSILSIQQLETIINEISKYYSIASNAEITLEANPENLNADYIKALSSIGINRLSIGIQSFDDEILKFLRRRHSAKQAFDVVEIAAENNITNISIDLIYGISGYSNQKWTNDLNIAFQLPITHLSCYCLTVEHGTLLARYQNENKYTPENDDICFNQFMIFHNKSLQNNFSHYEISNAAKKNFTSQHNSSYWNGNKYLGFGPSAHSFSENCRRWNVANVGEYIDCIKNNKIYFDSEQLTAVEQVEEEIMLSLRTANGLNLYKFSQKFGTKKTESLMNKLQNIPKHLYHFSNNTLKLSPEGMFLSDSIIIELID